MREQLTKFGTKDVRATRRNYAREDGRTLPAPPVQKSSSLLANQTSLPPLTTAELNRETQCIVLQFHTEQASDEQGAGIRAIELQKNGESGISTKGLINWARRNARVRAEVARLIGLTGRVTDPDFMEGMAKVAASIIREEAVAADDGLEAANEFAMRDLFGDRH